MPRTLSTRWRSCVPSVKVISRMATRSGMSFSSSASGIKVIFARSRNTAGSFNRALSWAEANVTVLSSERDGQHVLDADVRNFSIVDDGRFVGGEADFDLLHLASVEWMLLAKNFQRIQRGLDRANQPAIFLCWCG